MFCSRTQHSDTCEAQNCGPSSPVKQSTTEPLPFLSAIKNHVIKYCTTVYEMNGKKLFCSIKNSGEILIN